MSKRNPISYEKYSKLRDERQLNDAKVAASTGISQGTLSDWKSGRYSIKLDKLLSIAKLFGITLEELLSEEDS